MMMMMSCLSVCNVGILWTNGRLFQLLQCWALIYRPGSALCRTVFASSASASCGTKQRRQLHFQFASYHVCETVTLMCTSVAKRILIIKCTKFGQLILRKIIKILATRCHILRLKCTKFDFGWGSAPDPAGGAYSAPPDPLAGFKGAYF